MEFISISISEHLSHCVRQGTSLSLKGGSAEEDLVSEEKQNLSIEEKEILEGRTRERYERFLRKTPYNLVVPEAYLWDSANLPAEAGLPGRDTEKQANRETNRKENNRNANKDDSNNTIDPRANPPPPDHPYVLRVKEFLPGSAKRGSPLSHAAIMAERKREERDGVAPESESSDESSKRNLHRQDSGLVTNVASALKTIATDEVDAPEGSQARRNGLCTKRVLVMEKLQGKSVQAWSDARMEKLANSGEIIKRPEDIIQVPGSDSSDKVILKETFRERYNGDAGKLKSDLMRMTTAEVELMMGKMPDREKLNSYIQLLDYRDWTWNNVIGPVWGCVCAPYTITKYWIVGDNANAGDNANITANTNSNSNFWFTPYDSEQRRRDFVNPYDVTDALFDATAHLLFNHGLANGDPHPGE
jgi:hypothetical protein